ncbi:MULTISPECIES: chromosomal replication initiator protein DnaA [unclassified Gemella]|uniref:chromosomal replication initiator protein DnaA n=1 Tax=unclassified Gemella TaxID=2624949 RepID=UPI001073C7D9|nr:MULTISPECIES: chromosomal replication initiator protein DnaA [unclassified Gemella]MBF0710396.1 chromosomal replication initiator protein DnaA [Gemella sp. GL1.1]MBF0747155.1 chromosomal replication initiator protein DnaA [Gemella sp. 19428wG2_WT2a]NYS27740.1 chromosomal replication initiator protein DnaA [Gemella sp. GL1]TFU58158.1 chromosomal replication initiator protein DnaA [Gemella sp. WT2a]
MNDSNFLWQIILNQLKTELNSEVYSTWIEPNSIENVDMQNKTLTIVSSNTLISSYLQNVFDSKFKEILKTYTTLDFQIFYNFTGNTNPIVSAPVSTSIIAEPTSVENTFESNILKKFNSSNETSRQSFPKKYRNDFYTAPSNSETLKTSKQNPNLNKNFTFDNFVVGDGSKHVFNLAYASASTPGAHNPVFVYGGVGLGKTHLLHAIGNEMELQHPHFKIKCVTSEQFLNDYLKSIGKGPEHQIASEKFRQEYRSIDALLIDDIQFFSGKTGLQQAFFHIFNELYSSQKQIVLISDRDPSHLDGLDDRLVSRFDSGVIADITPPDYETRMRIITEKCEGLGLYLSENIVSFIAGNVSGNIRQIEGVLKNIKLMTDNGATASLDLVEDILKRRTKSTKKVILPENIINITSDYYNISVDDIFSAKRVKEIVTARMIAIYLCRELTDLSLPAIGSIFNKDHSSIHYAHSKVLSMIAENKNDILKHIESIKEKMN